MPRKRKTKPPDVPEGDDPRLWREEEFARTVGNMIRQFRVAAGWNQQAMADRLEIAQQDLSQLEVNGNPSAAVLYRLRGLGMNVDRIFDMEDGQTDPVIRAFEVASNLYAGGVVGVFPTRLAGLAVLKTHLERECRGVHIVGSSLKGVFMDRVLCDVLEERVRQGVEVKILMSHPAFAVLRAYVEGRESQGICQEIEEAKGYCERLKAEIRVALHPPTVFSIFLLSEGRALINPYFLTIEAYQTPCLLTADTGKRDCMYQQSHLYHFIRAWGSGAGREVSISLDDMRMKAQRVEEQKTAFREALDSVTQFGGSGRGMGVDTAEG